jgi:hypothetical protein
MARGEHDDRMESPSPSPQAPPLLDTILALTCAGCGAIHLLVAAGEGSGWLAAGVILGVIGTVQLVLAAALLLGIPLARPVTAIFSVAAAALWTLSTSAGLPIGPHPWTPETVTAPGIAVTGLELALAFALFALPSGRRAQAGRSVFHTRGSTGFGAPAQVSTLVEYTPAPPPPPLASFGSVPSAAGPAVFTMGWPPPPPAAFEAPATSFASAARGGLAVPPWPAPDSSEAPPPPLPPGGFGAPSGRAA